MIDGCITQLHPEMSEKSQSKTHMDLHSDIRETPEKFLHVKYRAGARVPGSLMEKLLMKVIEQFLNATSVDLERSLNLRFVEPIEHFSIPTLDVKYAVEEVSSHSAPSTDGVPGKFIKLNADEGAGSLALVFDRIIRGGSEILAEWAHLRSSNAHQKDQFLKKEFANVQTANNIGSEQQDSCADS